MQVTNSLLLRVSGTIIVGSLLYWFFAPAKHSGTRGLGEATRLKTLHDPVPSRYGLEV